MRGWDDPLRFNAESGARARGVLSSGVVGRASGEKRAIARARRCRKRDVKVGGEREGREASSVSGEETLAPSGGRSRAIGGSPGGSGPGEGCITYSKVRSELFRIRENYIKE